MSMLDFLSDEVVEGIPVGGGPFQPSGLIAKWGAGVSFRSFWSNIDLAELPIVPKFSARIQSNSGLYRYIFATETDAQEAHKVLNTKSPYETVWRFETDVATVLNFSDENARSKFENPILTYEVLIKTPSSKKHRHQFHLVALPSAVQAVALATGLIDGVIFHANELLMPDPEPTEENPNPEKRYTDAFWAEMLGDPDDKRPEAMLEGVLGKRRVELWTALGETNALAYRPIGDESKFAATSPKLSQALSIYNNKWKKQAFAEVVNYFDPSNASGVYTNAEGDVKRTRISAITRLFNTEGEAKAAAQEQLERRGKGGETAPAAVASTNGNGSAPAVPAAYAGYEQDFRNEFSRIKAGMTAGTPAYIKIASELGITKEEAAAWFNHI